MIYSTQISRDVGETDRWVDTISAKLYKLFFKVAPFLAGGQEANPRRYANISVYNRQKLDLKSGIVFNVVKINVANPKLQVMICVNGTISLIPTTYPVILEVVFTSFSIVMGGNRRITLPLPRPRGTLSTSFCDGDLRVSRGGRGGIFLAKKISI